MSNNVFAKGNCINCKHYCKGWNSCEADMLSVNDIDPNKDYCSRFEAKE